MQPDGLNRYSIPDLLRLLREERGERIRIEAGSPPSLTIKGQDHEIEGPVIEEELLEELLRSVADTRQMRVFREFNTVDIIHTLDGTRFLIRGVRAFGTFNVELHVIKG